ncbi:hypothetical protein BJH90_04810 [Bacillus halotolerans]|uniref:Uncharacterized protein n=1 Tax=Bacillus halotolerans TaxID=260554 RepID=A0A9Q6A6Z4_9BACI|nr:hypothetical protein CUU63_12905 [Bacillus halotolerans]PON02065.1 hypothetical protein BJH90_04810 [Bacillus halotolerans]
MNGASFFPLHTNCSENLLTDLAQQESAARQVDFKSYDNLLGIKLTRNLEKQKPSSNKIENKKTR